jgi:hypothetical protein
MKATFAIAAAMKSSGAAPILRAPGRACAACTESRAWPRAPSAHVTMKRVRSAVRTLPFFAYSFSVKALFHRANTNKSVFIDYPIKLMDCPMK